VSNPSQAFSWTSTGNYPAGPAPWNGQPLSVSPPGTYFVPSPANAPVPIAAENLNFILGQINGDLSQLFANGPVCVTTLTAFRALPVPTYNGTVLFTPSSSGTGGTGPITSYGQAFLGGIYYWDPACNRIDDGGTIIEPSAITGSSSGRWRLQSSPFTTVLADYLDVKLGAAYSNSFPATAGTYDYLLGGTGAPLIYTLNVNPGDPSAIYVGDLVDVEASFKTSFSGTNQNFSTQFALSSSIFPATDECDAFVSSASALYTNTINSFKYVISSADITAGSLTIKPTLTIGGSSAGSTLLQYLRVTLLRPS
jgi:hypothetical protein